jgi:hypothetical protein
MPLAGPMLFIVEAAALTAGETALRMLLPHPATYGPRTFNRSFSTSTYGTDIPRCRGTVRLPGNLIWATAIQESVWHAAEGTTLKGGTTFISYQYSCSCAMAFAKAMAGMGEASLIAFWADGKRIYSTGVSDASFSGQVFFMAGNNNSGSGDHFPGPPALQGDLSITVHTEAGSSLHLAAGTIIQWIADGDTNDYEVQEDVNLGANAVGQILIWPALQASHTKPYLLTAASIPGAAFNNPNNPNAPGPSIWDFTDWQVDVTSYGHYSQPGSPGVRFGAPPPGGTLGTNLYPTFYGGTQTTPDHVMSEYLDPSNVPAYKDLVYMVIDQIQLQNFGNHMPQFSAEICFEFSTATFPMAGPVLNADSSPAIASTAIVMATEVSSQGQVQAGPFVYAIDGARSMVYVINPSSMSAIGNWQMTLPNTGPTQTTDTAAFSAISRASGIVTATFGSDLNVSAGAAITLANGNGFDGSFTVLSVAAIDGGSPAHFIGYSVTWAQAGGDATGVAGTANMVTQIPTALMVPSIVRAGLDGFVYALGPTADGAGYIVVKYNGLTGAVAGWVGHGLSGVGAQTWGTNPLGQFISPQDMVLFSWYDANATVMRTLMVLVGAYGGVLVIDRDAMNANITAPTCSDSSVAVYNPAIVAYDSTFSTGLFHVNGGKITADADGHVWLAFLNSLVCYATGYGTPQSYTCPATLVTTPLTGLLSVDITAVVAAIGTVEQVQYSHAGNSIVLIGDNGVGLVDVATGTVTGWTVVNGIGSTGALGAPDTTGNLLLSNQTTKIALSAITRPGSTAVTQPYDFTQWITPVSTAGEYSWDSATNSVWVWSTGGSIFRLFLNRITGSGVDVANIITWLCAQTDLKSYQYDVTQITGLYSAQGIQFGQQSVRESILALCQIFMIDVVETNGAIHFLPRNRPPTITIAQEDLGAVDSLNKSEPRVEEVVTNETDMPERLSLIYSDRGRDYQQALQYEKRISQPYPANLATFRRITNSRLEQTITTPLSSDATTMKRQAQILLYDAWAARTSYSFKTAIKYLFLDPTDVVTLNYKGNAIELRLGAVDRGAGFALQFNGTSHDYQLYTSIAVSTVGGGLVSV